MIPEYQRRIAKFKTPRRPPSPPIDSFAFANLDDGREYGYSPPSGRRGRGEIRHKSAGSFLREPSSPPEWSSTTSASLTDSETQEKERAIARQERETKKKKPQLLPVTTYKQYEDVVKRKAQPFKDTAINEPPASPFPSSASILKDSKLDEFMKSSSRLYEGVYRRIKALEGVVEVLLDGYKELLGRVKVLEGKRKEADELGSHLGFFGEAVKEGRMPTVERVYEEMRGKEVRGRGWKAEGKRPVRLNR